MSGTTRRSRIALGVLLAVVAPAAPRAAEDIPPPVPSRPAPAPAAEGAGRTPLVEEMVITATRTPRSTRDVPAAVTVVGRAEIDRSPSKTLDELLRSVPSFGLFRQSSSVVADPSSQGVNLRGVAPSAVSRSLVLVDGIPATDPFGGWVYWRAIPRLGIQRIEVVPGGGSALYGNYALGGVTQVVSRPISSRSIDALAEGGSFDTGLFGLWAADRWGPIGAAVEGELLTTRGYPVVAEIQPRGAIDGNAPSEHAAASARLEAEATPDLSFAARGGWFYEDQNGGTRYTTASVKRFEYAASARYAPGALGAFDLALFGHRGAFEQGRARIVNTPLPRSAEFPSASQSVPMHDLGAGLVWTSAPLPLAGTHTLVAGSDARRITGDTREDLFPATGPTQQREAKGQQRLLGLFAQDVYDLSEAFTLSFAVRYDLWVNSDASRFDSALAPALVEFPRRSDSQLSPKAGLRLRAAEWLTFRAGAYRAFRAPTLNELYRSFQVGTVFTQANEDLGPEKLLGAEAGLEVAAGHGLGARATGFWNQLDDPIVSVTTGPSLRQRQNLGRARIAGVEAEASWRPGSFFVATAAWTFASSEVTGAPGQPQLVGKALPLDPWRRGRLSLAFDDPSLLSAAVQVRYVGPQYEDDQNTAHMGDFALVDLSASRRVGADVELVFAVENLLDKQYLVGRAGVDTVGQPRFVHGGIRVRYGQ